MIIKGASEIKVEKLKNKMMRYFERTDLGLLCSYLGIEVHQSIPQIFLSQKPYAANIFENFKMADCNLTKTLVETHLKLMKDGGERGVDVKMYRSLIRS